MSTKPNDGRGLSPAKRALLEIRALKARVRELERVEQPIALVGMGCRFPGGVQNAEDLWTLLMSGRDAIVEVPPDRWDAERFYDPDPAVPGRMATRWGGFIDGVDRFDAAFFGISPREAQRMDPQQRLLLEVAWEALEHAGIAPDVLAGTRAGVFVGIAALDHAHDLLSEPEGELDGYVPQAMAHSAASGRIAYALGLQGPALSVDTACSSSLSAVHLAVQSLRRGESSLALAGGVNVLRYPQVLIAMSKAGMMAADGRCKAFDDRGDGFVRAEGCGLVVLKRLDDAVADGDHVWAVIQGSAMNQDGRSSGLTAPNRLAQETVLRDALADAGVAATGYGYVEAHGTGTALGDPIEVGALASVLGEGRTRPLPIGSIKSNLGHLEAAAGVAGLIKAALVMHHELVPPTLHVELPNARIPWREIAIEVGGSTRRFEGSAAGVSSFGFTGTNVHVVLSPAPARKSAPDGRLGGARVLKLSARTAPALRQLAERWAARLREEGLDFAGACRTANRGRADLAERIALVAHSATAAADALDAYLRGDPCEAVFTGRERGAGEDEVAFLFTGHGAQYAGMGRGLAAAFPVFRRALEECDASLRTQLERPLLDVLADAAALDTMRCAQPALFAVGYALAKLWQSWGVRPTLVLGHSVGEYAAACVAGVIPLEDAITLVAARGRLMDSLTERGSMAALFTTEERVARALATTTAVSIAAVNGPAEVVISGRTAAVDAIVARLAADGVEARRLAVGGAAHSPLLDPILDEFESVARQAKFAPPELGLVSGTSGRMAWEEVRTAAYWRRHLREPVRFHDALRTARDADYRLFVDIGPHPTLAGLGRRAFPDDDAAWAPSLREGRDERAQLLEGMATLWAAGGRVDWRRLEDDLAAADGRRADVVRAPTYPWQHRAFPRPPVGAPRAGAADAWPAAVAAGERAQHTGPLDFRPEPFAPRWQALERLALEIIADTLRALGAFQRAGERGTVAEVAARAGVRVGYQGLLRRWLDRLADAQRLERQGEAYRAPEPVAPRDLAAARTAARALLAGDGEFLADYVDRCAAALPEVLRGRAEPLETLFPDGSTATADMLYRDWALVRYLAGVQRAATEAFARRRAATGGLRLLEVGAGTGGTTAELLPALEDHLAEYAFTDVSPLFLDRAAERFRAHAALRVGTLDLDRDPEPQGWAAGRWDLVIASNVLHATRDLPRTLARIRRLLAPGGALIALEITRYLAWYDVSTALLEGWDRADDALRPRHAMLDDAGWRSALLEAGFDRVAALPDAAAPTRDLGFHVLLACTPLDASVSPSIASGSGTPVPAVAARPEAEEMRERLLAAHPQEREELLVELVRRQIAALLRLGPEEPIHRRRRLMELGLDSLMAVELRSRLNASLELAEPLPSTLVFDYPTIDAIVGLLSARLGHAPIVAEPAARVPAGGAIESMTEQEAEQRLLRALDALEDLP